MTSAYNNQIVNNGRNYFFIFTEKLATFFGCIGLSSLAYSDNYSEVTPAITSEQTIFEAIQFSGKFENMFTYIYISKFSRKQRNKMHRT